jgi:hypothetical protein
MNEIPFYADNRNSCYMLFVPFHHTCLVERFLQQAGNVQTNPILELAGVRTVHLIEIHAKIFHLTLHILVLHTDLNHLGMGELS